MLTLFSFHTATSFLPKRGCFMNGEPEQPRRESSLSRLRDEHEVSRATGRRSKVDEMASKCGLSARNYLWFLGKLEEFYELYKDFQTDELRRQRSDCLVYVKTYRGKLPELKTVALETERGRNVTQEVFLYYTNSVAVEIADIILSVRGETREKGKADEKSDGPGMAGLLGKEFREQIDREQARFRRKAPNPDAVAALLRSTGIRPDIANAIEGRQEGIQSDQTPPSSGAPSGSTSLSESGRQTRRLGTSSGRHQATGASGEPLVSGKTTGDGAASGSASAAAATDPRKSPSGRQPAQGSGARSSTSPSGPSSTLGRPSGRFPGPSSGRHPAVAPETPSAPPAVPQRPAPPPLPTRAAAHDDLVSQLMGETPTPTPSRTAGRDLIAWEAELQEREARLRDQETMLHARAQAIHKREVDAGEQHASLERWSSELAIREAEANASDTTLRGREESIEAQERANAEQAAEIVFGREELGREKAAFLLERNAARTTLSAAQQAAGKQKELQTTLDLLTTNIAQAEERKGKIPGEIKKLEDRLEALRREIRMANAEKDKLVGKIKELEAEVARLVAQRDALLREQSALESSLEALRSDHSRLTTELEALRGEETQEQARVATIREEKERLEAEVAALSLRQEELIQSISELNQRIDALRTREVEAAEISRRQAEVRLPVSVSLSNSTPTFDFSVWSAPHALMNERAMKLGSVKSLQVRLDRLAGIKNDPDAERAREDFESLELARTTLGQRIQELDGLIETAIQERERAMEAYRALEGSTQTISALTAHEQSLLIQWEAEGEQTTELRLTRQELDRALEEAEALRERVAEITSDPLLEVFRAVDRD